MKTPELTHATAPLAEYARKVSQEPVILTLNGKPVAALVSIENTDWETLSLSTHPQFIELIERARARQRAEGGLSSNQVRELLGLDRKTRKM